MDEAEVDPMIRQHGPKLLADQYRQEIEKAIDKVKLGMVPAKRRTDLDEWFRRRFYIETARIGKREEHRVDGKSRWRGAGCWRASGRRWKPGYRRDKREGRIK